MNEEHASYLKKIKFDPILDSGWNAKFLRNPRLLILLLLIIIILGVYSFINLPRRLNPEIKIPIVLVSTVIPGAGPKDVESLVTIKLEDALTNLSKLKTVTSTSRDSVSIISLEFESGTDPDKALQDVQAAVNGVTDLPTDAQKSTVQKLDFENQPVWQFALTSKGDYASTLTFARTLKDRIKNLPSIREVNISGLEEEEIQVLIKPTAVSTYKINPQLLTASISQAIKSFPSGSVKTDKSVFALTIDPAVTTVDDIRNLKLNLNGTIVSFQDIADIQLRSKPGQTQAFLAYPNAPPRKVISFSVFRSSSSTIQKAVADSQKEVDSLLSSYPNQFTVADIENVSTEISKQFNDLIRDLSTTIALVFIVLIIFLGSKQAIVSSFSIPLTFFITFTVMLISGIAFSFIAFFSLLLALGLLVDDTIVVISAMTSYYRSGKFSPFQTGLLVWRDFVVAIFTTTITTVWAFVPLLLSSGIIGEFIKPIPIVVSTTLIASFIIAMFVTLPVMIILLEPKIPRRVSILFKSLVLISILALFYLLIPKSSLLLLEILFFLIFLFIVFQVRDQLWQFFKSIFSKIRLPISGNYLKQSFNNGFISFEHLSIRYQGFIKKILNSKGAIRKTVAMVIIFSIFSYLLVPLKFVKNEFFPKEDSNFLFISIELPAGTNLEQSKAQALDLTEKVRHNPNLKFVIAEIGQSLSSQGGAATAEVNNILFTLVLLDSKDRPVNSSDIAENLRKQLANYTAGKLSVVEQSGGPPAGADIQIKLIGDDLGVLDKYATQIEDYLKKQPGITNVDRSVKSGTSKLVFSPDRQKLAESNLDLSQIGFWLRLYASGFKADALREGTQQKDITIRLSNSTQYTESLSSLTIPTQNGVIPLDSLGKLSLEPNPTLITRENSKRTISVTASATKGTNIPDKNAQLEKFADTLNLPPGYSWKTGGVNEENNNSVTSILMAMILSFMLIILTMVIQFSSFRKAIIVMLVIPLSISGVFIIFALTNTPLSFPALIGILALFGIVVKNSILVVDKITQNERASLEFTEAIAEGAASRLEPIALTTLAAIMGLVPITLSNPLWRGLGGAIIAGLTFSGTIMLFFIPVIYSLWLKPKMK